MNDEYKKNPNFNHDDVLGITGRGSMDKPSEHYNFPDALNVKNQIQQLRVAATPTPVSTLRVPRSLNNAPSVPKPVTGIHTTLAQIPGTDNVKVNVHFARDAADKAYQSANVYFQQGSGNANLIGSTSDTQTSFVTAKSAASSVVTVQSVGGSAILPIEHSPARAINVNVGGRSLLQQTPAIVSAGASGGGGGGGGGGINQLTGDVTAGPGGGSQAATLATVNSNVGSYTSANITVNAKGLITAAANGSTGVTSVGIAVPSWQTVSGSPVTSSGTITISDNNQSANAFFAGPSSGSAAAPTFRAIAPADLPIATTSALGAVKPDGTTITITSGGVISGASSGVTSIAIAVPSWQTVSGSPITTSGTITISDNTQSANLIFAGPSSGSAAAPTFRALATADIPADNTIRTISCVIDGGGSPPTTGVKSMIVLPFACTITSWTCIADQSGSANVDIWYVAGSGAPPTAPNIPNSGNKISASAPVALTSAQSAAGGSSAISTWSPTSLAQWGTIAFNLSSVTTCTRVSVQLFVQLA